MLHRPFTAEKESVSELICKHLYANRNRKVLKKEIKTVILTTWMLIASCYLNFFSHAASLTLTCPKIFVLNRIFFYCITIHRSPTSFSFLSHTLQNIETMDPNLTMSLNWRCSLDQVDNTRLANRLEIHTSSK